MKNQIKINSLAIYYLAIFGVIYVIETFYPFGTQVRRLFGEPGLFFGKVFYAILVIDFLYVVVVSIVNLIIKYIINNNK